MAKFYFPKPENLKIVTALMQGFWLEIDDSDNPVLILKLEASLSSEIIKGCSIEIIIRNPNLLNRACTLYIYDIPNDPISFTWKNFGIEDSIAKGFDEVAIKLAKSKKIILAIFNELNISIFSTELEIESNFQEFTEWLFKVYNLEPYKYLEKPEAEGYYMPETEFKGFKINIINKDNSNEKKLTILAPEFGVISDDTDVKYTTFNYDDYAKNGKHGYYQELSIANNLSRFFRNEIDFFRNPVSLDGIEFTDFIITYGKSVILLESKNVVSEKQTKKHSAITKAITQLVRAEELILQKKVCLTDSKLSEILNNAESISKICLVNAKLILTEENTKNLTNKFTKIQMPLFISVTTFFNLITSLKLKNPNFLMQNIISNFSNTQVHYLNSDDKIFYLRSFSVEGLSVDEINKMGNFNFFE